MHTSGDQRPELLQFHRKHESSSVSGDQIPALHARAKRETLVHDRVRPMSNDLACVTRTAIAAMVVSCTAMYLIYRRKMRPDESDGIVFNYTQSPSSQNRVKCACRLRNLMVWVVLLALLGVAVGAAFRFDTCKHAVGVPSKLLGFLLADERRQD